MFAEILLRPLGHIVNRGIDRSTSAAALARDLEGRVLGLRVDASPLDLRLRVTGGRVSIGLPDGAAPDAVVSGSVLSLLRLLEADAEGAIREGGARISGDADIAERFRALLRFAAPDLEEELSQLVGDPLARQAGNAARGLADWSARAAQGVGRSAADYLQDEAQLIVSGAEVAAFAAAVDTLVDDVARAEARLARLEETP